MKLNATTLFSAFAALLFCVMPVHAGSLTLTIEASSAQQGSTGNFFDLILTNTTGSVQNVAADAFNIVSSDPSITFTSADELTTDPYLFAGDSFDVDFSFPLNTTTGISIMGSDLSSSSNGTNMAVNAVYGIARIFYDVSSLAPLGDIQLTVDTNNTNFADSSLPQPQQIGYVPQNAAITVSAATPEPSTFLLLLPLLPFLAALRRKHSRGCLSAKHPDFA